MGRINFEFVRARALEEAKADLRLDTPVRIVTSLIAPFISAGVVWLATDSVAWGSIAGAGVLLAIGAVVFATKLLSVPYAIANEALTANEVITAKVADLEGRIIELTAPPPLPPTREPDALYQLGAIVAKVRYATEARERGFVHFVELQDAHDLNLDRTFEYRDLLLRVTHIGPHHSMAAAGQKPNKTIEDVACNIEGLRP